ncbi:MAG: DUF5690 family protein [Bacteroidia bacterium]
MQDTALLLTGKQKLSNWLNHSTFAFVAFASLTVFVIYTSMYGFRKPYTVGIYSQLSFLGISYKVCLVIAQVIGYMISKFYGIRFISSMNPQYRANYILLFIGIAWSSLLLFALIPPPYNIICMFINGLPLGMVFGLVFGFIEGRRTTEIMGAMLAVSFIFASGLSKTIGKWLLLDFNISEWWMPFAAGGFFVLPLLFFIWMLRLLPPPSAEDIASRNIRLPMTRVERKQFLSQFGLPMATVVFAYAIFTIVRDFCEDFANELWMETGYKNNAGIFAQTNTIIALVVLGFIAAFFLIKNNSRAFRLSHYLVIFGLCLLTVSTAAYNLHKISTLVWMIIATSGLYLAYLPFNCLYFERMLSTYRMTANIGFAMYIADAFGYLGTVLVLLVKEFITIKYSWVDFFTFLFYSAGFLGIILISITLILHSHLLKKIKCN